MWTKIVILGVTAVGVMGATSACGSAEGDIPMEAETGAAEIVPPQFCGGIAGIPCPEGSRCVDDPSDSCDPDRGGADCGGVCIAVEPESEPESEPEPAIVCGSALCGAGQFCCNASCSICAPEGGFCTQQECVAEAD